MDCRKYYDKVGESGLNSWDLTRFQETLQHLLHSGSLFDVGCGEGYWLKFLSQNTNLQLLGADISPVRLNISRNNLNGTNVPLCISDIRKLGYRDRTFNQVTALEVLEHVPEWQDGLTELVRVASKRVIITVPYNERLKYENCQNCGERAYLYGHLNRFSEDNFLDLNIDGKTSFEKLEHPLGLDHYIKRVFKGILRKTKEITRMDNINGHASTTICINCYEEVPYTKYFERGFDRLLKMVTHSPEYLLVKIDK